MPLQMAQNQPNLTLYFLQSSRSIRIAWLLEELQLPYKVECWDREDTGLAPAEFKKRCGTRQGKAPVLKDGDLILQESGAITETRYLCENYDPSHKLFPLEPLEKRTKIREWIHAAEGMFMTHCLPTVYNRRIDASLAEKLAPGIEKIVAKDLDCLEEEISTSEGKYLVGDDLTAADIMVAFAVDFILAMGLVPNNMDKSWPRVRSWLAQCLAREAYRGAVEKTGHKL